jgi:hypothetical protein
VRCTKTARPDLQMCPACQPPPIRDRKLNHDTLAMARVFQQTAKSLNQHQALGMASAGGDLGVYKIIPLSGSYRVQSPTEV